MHKPERDLEVGEAVAANGRLNCSLVSAPKYIKSPKDEE